jgi:hypothetical protein
MVIKAGPILRSLGVFAAAKRVFGNDFTIDDLSVRAIGLGRARDRDRRRSLMKYDDAPVIT